MLAAFGRSVHVNTGTRGMPDGSTVFWESEKMQNWLTNGDQKGKLEYWMGAPKGFMRKDLKDLENNVIKPLRN